ncbi:neutral zinc metallopeptidase [Pseudooctadecabacter jejudonensis]|uniref:Neutral zinc metallopeptidase n=1 Tax=Pseudooctadecabacter jejudonensis TaxID=1391910 RepID=A0A1Y5RGC9_9RHOB|nr:hypothetical protein [Pseudooctadecabacter jejudonensis]SLN15606.1 hypothetical protein PSJ8397_00349 [Pseudooctadecabacter jejudonensis]
MRLIFALTFCATPVVADPYAVVDTARAMFDRMPEVQMADPLAAQCGAGAQTNPQVFYCTSDNTIYHGPDFPTRPQAGYEMAHLLGHAVQVQHGVADVALRTITRNRDREAELRGMVERQVNCIAGVLMARAGQPGLDIATAFDGEPFQNAHWGRSPVDDGPHLPIGVAAVQEWLDRGYQAQDVSVCAVGEFGSELLVEALND